MKKKRFLIGSIVIIVLMAIVMGVYIYFTRQDADSTLTILEKQWIENNKNNVIDLSIITDIPVLNYGGSGLVLDFVNDLEEDTNLQFNRLADDGTSEEVKSYAFQIKNKVEDNDILIYEDHYVLLSKSKNKIYSLNDLANKSIGVLTDDLTLMEEYLNVNQNLSYKTYDTSDALLADLENGSIDIAALPRLQTLDKIIASQEVNIIYHVNEYKVNYVLTLGDVDKLNVILKKYYNKWQRENFESIFNNYLTTNYFTFAEISQEQQVSFKSKRYKYGFVENYPYDVLDNNRLVGINSNVLKVFSDVADIDIEYADSYNSIGSLVSNFNENKIDLFFSNNANNDYDLDVYKTVSISDEKLVIATSYKHNIHVNSLKSLNGLNVLTVKNSKIAEMLEDAGANLREYDTLEKLVDSAGDNSIIAIDYDSYMYYVHDELDDYGIVYCDDIDEVYGFTIRDISDNQVFANYLDFYISFIDTDYLVNDAYATLLIKDNHINLFTLFLTIVGGAIVCLFAIFGLYKYVHIGAKKLSKMGKNDKIKYIDMLTSLKNRNYLNDNIDAWDESEIYPQSIVIVDLNNVSYINDNYGHQEGDNVIKEAANILIKTQIDNSDIIRTNGNEFLIYLVGHDEKEIVAYIRKLNKEMKTIAHGFGAAVGYSMITDAIKTIDDAVNEATLDMRTQKEEANNN